MHNHIHHDNNASNTTNTITTNYNNNNMESLQITTNTPPQNNNNNNNLLSVIPSLSGMSLAENNLNLEAMIRAKSEAITSFLPSPHRASLSISASGELEREYSNDGDLPITSSRRGSIIDTDASRRGSIPDLTTTLVGPTPPIRGRSLLVHPPNNNENNNNNNNSHSMTIYNGSADSIALLPESLLNMGYNTNRNVNNLVATTTTSTGSPNSNNNNNNGGMNNNNNNNTSDDTSMLATITSSSSSPYRSFEVSPSLSPTSENTTAPFIDETHRITRRSTHHDLPPLVLPSPKRSLESQSNNMILPFTSTTIELLLPTQQPKISSSAPVMEAQTILPNQIDTDDDNNDNNNNNTIVNTEDKTNNTLPLSIPTVNSEGMTYSIIKYDEQQSSMLLPNTTITLLRESIENNDNNDSFRLISPPLLTRSITAPEPIPPHRLSSISRDRVAVDGLISAFPRNSLSNGKTRSPSLHDTTGSSLDEIEQRQPRQRDSISNHPVRSVRDQHSRLPSRQLQHDQTSSALDTSHHHQSSSSLLVERPPLSHPVSLTPIESQQGISNSGDTITTSRRHRHSVMTGRPPMMSTNSNTNLINNNNNTNNNSNNNLNNNNNNNNNSNLVISAKSSDSITSQNNKNVLRYIDINGLLHSPKPIINWFSHRFINDKIMENNYQLAIYSKTSKTNLLWTLIMLISFIMFMMYNIFTISYANINNNNDSNNNDFLYFYMLLIIIPIIFLIIILLSYYYSNYYYKSQYQNFLSFLIMTLITCTFLYIINIYLNSASLYSYSVIIFYLCINCTLSTLRTRYSALSAIIIIIFWFSINLLNYFNIITSNDNLINNNNSNTNNSNNNDWTIFAMYTGCCILYVMTAYYDEYQRRLAYLFHICHENEQSSTRLFLNNMLPKSVLEALNGGKRTNFFFFIFTTTTTTTIIVNTHKIMV